MENIDGFGRTISTLNRYGDFENGISVIISFEDIS